ncbi:MAG TPA: beta-ketoacyl-ACP synthase III [Nitrospiria bacterium]
MIKITGTGSCIPDRCVRNEELAPLVGLSPAGILKRTGIRERRWAEKDQASSDLAAVAVKKALEAAGRGPEELDAIILATTSPDMLFPSTACLVQRKLGNRKAFAFDLSASCAGFLFALSTAHQFLRGEGIRTVAVVASEIKSRFIDVNDPATAVIFADGAGAAIVEHVSEKTSSENGIRDIRVFSDGTQSGLIRIPAGGSRRPVSAETLKNDDHVIRMKGGPIFRSAVRKLVETTGNILEHHGLTPGDIDHFVFHQANARILAAVAKRLSLPLERVVTTLDRFGNTSSASIPMALDVAVRSGRVKPGDRIFLGGFGGGLNWGGALIRW